MKRILLAFVLLSASFASADVWNYCENWAHQLNFYANANGFNLKTLAVGSYETEEERSALVGSMQEIIGPANTIYSDNFYGAWLLLFTTSSRGYAVIEFNSSEHYMCLFRGDFPEPHNQG